MTINAYTPFVDTENTIGADWYTQVGRGKVPGASLVNIQGNNTAMPTTFRAAWELANTTAYVFPASALAMAFTSSSAETLTMRVDGLDANYATKTATITFTASTTGVVTVGDATFFRINRMIVTSGTNVGNISATNGGVTYSYIAAGGGTSQASVYTVPAGSTFFLTRAQAFTTNNGTQYCTYRVFSQTITGGVTTSQIVLAAPFTQFYSSTRIVPRGYVEKTDIQWQLSQSNPAPGSIQLEGILIANTAL